MTDTLKKIVSLEKLISVVGDAQAAGQKVVFTNGCFDILHVGHVRYLTAARHAGDLLVIGLNSDRSVRSIKGTRRPIISQDQRAEVLAGLGCVDFVVLFDEPDPLVLIESLNPNILVKGEDWPENRIVGAAHVKSNGGQVMRIKFTDEMSTSVIIDRIIATYCRGADALD
jgi:D-beta-D-heptose 7-phosphate kinase/D-beta-D-heptose 1-phosphate adenosyltransferase